MDYTACDYKSSRISSYIGLFEKLFANDKVHLAHSWAQKTLVQLLTRYRQIVPRGKLEDKQKLQYISRARKLVADELIQSELEGAATAAE